MDIKVIADVMLACCNMCFALALAPQLRCVYQLKKASQLSWLFLGVTTLALTVSIGALLMLKCYFAAIAEFIQWLQYIGLSTMKYVYDKENRQ